MFYVKELVDMFNKKQKKLGRRERNIVEKSPA